jgi:DNA polymerase III delta subunit
MTKEYTLQAFLKNFSLPNSGYLIIYGDEPLLHDSFFKKLDNLKLKYNVYNGEDLNLDKFIEILGEKHLFSIHNAQQKNLTIIKRAERFFQKLKGKQKKLLTTLVSKKPKNLVILSFLTTYKKSELSREPLKTLFSNAELILKAQKLSKQQVYQLIKKKFKSMNIKVDDEVVKFLMETFEDLTTLRTELDKLTTYALDKSTLTLEEVKNLVFGTPKVSVFDLQDAFFSKNLREFLFKFENITKSLTSYELNSLIFQLVGLFLSTANRLLILNTIKNPTYEVYKNLGIVYQFQIEKYNLWKTLWDEVNLKNFIKALYKTEFLVKVYFNNPKEVFLNTSIKFLAS